MADETVSIRVTKDNMADKKVYVQITQEVRDEKIVPLRITQEVRDVEMVPLRITDGNDHAELMRTLEALTESFSEFRMEVAQKMSRFNDALNEAAVTTRQHFYSAGDKAAFKEADIWLAQIEDAPSDFDNVLSRFDLSIWGIKNVLRTHLPKGTFPPEEGMEP
jgi:hypothetical protein